MGSRRAGARCGGGVGPVTRIGAPPTEPEPDALSRTIRLPSQP